MNAVFMLRKQVTISSVYIKLILIIIVSTNKAVCIVVTLVVLHKHLCRCVLSY